MNVSAVSDHSVLGRVLRFPLRLIPRETRVWILQGRLRGKRWVAGSSINGCWLGTYEWEKQREFERTVRPGWVIYDVGAHVGFYSLLAAELAGDGGKVYAFEPASRNLRYLRKHVEMNRASTIDVRPFGVAATTGTASMASGPPGMVGTMGHIADEGDVTIQTVSLDGFLDDGALPPDLIKMDIEGGEARALRGASRILREHRPVIFLATHGDDVHAECLEILGSHGYRLRTLSTPDELLATPMEAPA